MDGGGSLDRDTIAAVATPPGRGGIGIVRLSGAAAGQIAECMAGPLPPPRQAALRTFRDVEGRTLDQGIVLFFPGPRSYTGEDVIELQAHGGPVVMDLLLESALVGGARLARPGEFTERAYLNDRIDLAQAEAVLDLIDSGTKAAARNAARSMSGEFSRRVSSLGEAILDLRVYVEAAIDFPEEEVDFLADGVVLGRLQALRADVAAILAEAAQGALLNEGITVVIAGRPNAGKSSLLNQLAGYDRAIVTELPGTTRDVLSERITLGGLPIQVVDTAGLRDSGDVIEREGVRRARLEIAGADRVLLVFDATEPEDPLAFAREEGLPLERLTIVFNKMDLVGPTARLETACPSVRISALTGVGLDDLAAHLKEVVGLREDEGGFSARRRHLDALRRALDLLDRGIEQLSSWGAGELVAEDLRCAHEALGEILGRVTSDELLGSIFSSFCIGK